MEQAGATDAGELVRHPKLTGLDDPAELCAPYAETFARLRCGE
jgi:hypothetical protein